MQFTKMHGCGNDHIIINGFKENFKLKQSDVVRLCSQHFGIGSEGLIFALPSKIADFKMQMLNVDGTEAEMCGNGIRCLAKFAYDEGIVSKKIAMVETKAGIKRVELMFDGSDFVGVKVNMGKAKFLENPVKEYDLNCVSVGNPHAVVVVKEVENFPVKEIGAKIENHIGFPNKTNVEFVEVLDRNNVAMRVWERGCGETFACGTGSCATVATLNKIGLVDNVCIVHLRGGSLKIEIVKEEIFMIGNAITVFKGEVWL